VKPWSFGPFLFKQAAKIFSLPGFRALQGLPPRSRPHPAWERHSRCSHKTNPFRAGNAFKSKFRFADKGRARRSTAQPEIALEVGDGFLEALFKGDLRLPIQMLPGQGNIRLALHRVIRGKVHKNDF